MADRIRLTRKELYDLVWSTSMVQLAKGYGLSDVALRKKCVRAEIPTPALGYWAKVAAKQRVKKTPLPKAKKGTPETIEIPLPRAATPEPAEAPPAVEVPDNLRSKHEVVQYISEEFKNATTEKYGRLETSSRFVVSNGQVTRILKLTQALVTALETRGAVIEMDTSSTWHRAPHLFITIGEARLTLSAEELLSKAAYKPTARELENERKYNYPIRKKWTKEPNGRLSLGIAGVPKEYAGAQFWSDYSKDALEDQLGRIVVRIEQAAEFTNQALQQKRRQREERERQHWVERKKVWIRTYQQELAKDLRRMASDWDESQRITRFLDACEREAPGNDISSAWLKSSRAYAAALDPLSRRDEVAKNVNPSEAELRRVHEAIHGPEADPPQPKREWWEDLGESRLAGAG